MKFRSTGNNKGFNIHFDNTNEKLKIQSDDSGTTTDVMTLVGPQGYVGIGTDSPVSNLDVRGTAASGVADNCIIRLLNSNCQSYGTVLSLNETNMTIDNGENGYLAFNVNGGTGMIIHPDGKVGIGTGTTYVGFGGETLKVNGTVKATKFIGDLEGNAATASTATQVQISNYDTAGNFNVPFVVHSAGVGSLYYKSQSSKSIYFNPNKGFLGIGTSSPNYPLCVDGYTTWAAGGGRDYFDYTVPAPREWQYDTKAFNLGLDVQYYVWAKGYTTSSDVRIKKNIRDLSDNESLIKLRDISCVHYEYIDEVKSGGRPTIGFLAQQVASVYPEAVSLVPNYIPNEYRNLTDTSWNEVTITENSGNIKTKYYLTSESMGDVSGCKYRFQCRDLSANLKEEEIELKGDEYNRFEFKYKYPEIFLYGKEVVDFHILDKQKIFAVAFSATQEIDRIQQEEKTKLAAAEAEITALKTQLAAVLARLDAIESN